MKYPKYVRICRSCARLLKDVTGDRIATGIGLVGAGLNEFYSSAHSHGITCANATANLIRDGFSTQACTVARANLYASMWARYVAIDEEHIQHYIVNNNRDFYRSCKRLRTSRPKDESLRHLCKKLKAYDDQHAGVPQVGFVDLLERIINDKAMAKHIHAESFHYLHAAAHGDLVRSVTSTDRAYFQTAVIATAWSAVATAEAIQMHTLEKNPAFKPDISLSRRGGRLSDAIGEL